jgi:hypothetical protein
MLLALRKRKYHGLAGNNSSATCEQTRMKPALTAPSMECQSLKDPKHIRTAECRPDFARHTSTRRITHLIAARQRHHLIRVLNTRRDNVTIPGLNSRRFADRENERDREITWAERDAQNRTPLDGNSGD